MRLCPTVEGSASPLITHRIGADVCLARQATNFHKCHRCIFRGQAADWLAEEPEQSVIRLHSGEEKEGTEVKEVVIPRPEPVAARRLAAGG